MAYSADLVAKAVLKSLKNNASIKQLGVGVYTHVPCRAKFPYLKVEISENQFDVAVDLELSDFEIQVQGFDKSRSPSKSYKIQKAVYESLHRQPILIAGHQTLELKYEFGNVFSDEEDVFQNISRFKLTVN